MKFFGSICTWRPLFTRAQYRLQNTKIGKELTPSKPGREASINPLDLTEDNISEMYCVPTDDVRGSFASSLPRLFSTEVEALRQACWLLRRQSYDIMKELRKYDTNQPQKFRYLLYGEDGTGKTVCLHQILHHSIKAGWLVVFIPGVFSWTHSAEELRPSSHHPGTYDQPEAAIAWLKAFRSLNSHFTSQLRLSRDWEWGKKDHSSAGEEVNKVIEKGLLKPQLATEVVAAVLDELVVSSERFKMILAVDEFNGCFNPTTLKTPEKEWVEPQQLNLVRALLRHIPQFPGAVLLSLSRSRMLRCPATDWRPSRLLSAGVESTASRREAEALLKSCCTVEVPPYSRQEMETCLHYYSDRRWVNRELIPVVLNELWHLTSGRPHVLHRLCTSL